MDTSPAAQTSSEASSAFDTRYVPHIKQAVSHLLGWIKVGETVNYI